MAENFPIRCWTCNRVINKDYIEYKKLISEGLNEFEALDKLKYDPKKRYCCRIIFMTHIDISKVLVGSEESAQRIEPSGKIDIE